MPIELGIRLIPIPGIPQLGAQSPLGLLAPLAGKWQGSGFNQIFRPMEVATQGSDNFLELNLTNETLEFTEIPGEIPNRGLLQPDISLFGLTYLQQVTDANVTDTSGRPAGIHIEPGIWINIPATTNPQEPATVARLASIPHGTSLLAQGTATIFGGPPQFAPVDITPFPIGQPGNRGRFPSQDLVNPTPFRSPDPDIVGITQAMVDNPNSVLQAALAGKTINSTTVIQISTISDGTTVPNDGGGIADIAFLEGAGNPNAQVFSMDATFWISEFTGTSGSGIMLQYSQTVLLNFFGLSWPHVSVASLIKQSAPPKARVKDLKDSLKDNLKVEIKEHLPENKPPIPEHKPIKEFKEYDGLLPSLPDPGQAGHAAAAPAEGRHFITPAERPTVGEAALREERDQHSD